MTEPRARAAKNVGKANFSSTELSTFLTAHGDSPVPLPETVKILDEIATEFIQGLSFEATRVAHHAGRQKVKFEDFQFVMRRNPEVLGKVQEMLEKKQAISEARKVVSDGKDELATLAAEEATKNSGGVKDGGGGGKDGAGSTIGPGSGGGKKGGKRKGKKGQIGDGDGVDGDDDVASSAPGGKRRKMGQGQEDALWDKGYNAHLKEEEDVNQKPHLKHRNAPHQAPQLKHPYQSRHQFLKESKVRLMTKPGSDT
ncbi:hypothetical protein MKZ38_009179 [Zalerion maritima]|uniref:Transcription initiation factor TFIID subunit 13 n=1 Tax=Zalerion maritima TaxID=339359 RepID=A0AAD5RVI4_9PEZI|nr:hypothetical protein MKZ38_009179 [Zalerion maritima]